MQQACAQACVQPRVQACVQSYVAGMCTRHASVSIYNRDDKPYSLWKVKRRDAELKRSLGLAPALRGSNADAAEDHPASWLMHPLTRTQSLATLQLFRGPPLTF